MTGSASMSALFIVRLSRDTMNVGKEEEMGKIDTPPQKYGRSQ
jgi:hypothetical protein